MILFFSETAYFVLEIKNEITGLYITLHFCLLNIAKPKKLLFK